MICNNCKKEIGTAAVCPFCGTRMLKDPLPHHMPAGSIVGGRYRIDGVLGEGGFGITYLGVNVKLDRPVAVKEYYPHGFSYRNTASGNEVFVSQSDAREFFEHGKARFLDEAKTLVRFDAEPGVVSVIDFFEENNTAYLVMEYLEGVTLQQYLIQHGRLSADEAFTLLEPVMRTLEKIHASGVIHRDISPDNIMRLNGGQLKLMDFGAAKEYVDDTRSMSVMLKKGYAPEEQYRRNGRQGPWTDVYALCATIYRCITGRAPDESLDRLAEDTLQSPSHLGAAISPTLENVLLYGLAVRQKDRCQSVTELLYLIGEAKKITPSAPRYPQPAAPVYQPPAAPVVRHGLHEQNATVYADEDPSVMKQAKPASRAPMQKVAAAPSAPLQKTAPKKSRTGVVIGSIAAVLVIAIVIGIIVIKPWSGSSEEEKTKTGKWTDIAYVSAGNGYTIALQEDGTLLTTGDNTHGQCDVGKWTDVIAVSAGTNHTVGLKSDGTVIAVGYNASGKCDVGNWRGITAVSAGGLHTVGLKKGGSAIAVGKNTYGQCEVESWYNLSAICAGGNHTVGLKKNGTVIAAGYNQDGQCDVESWKDMYAIAAGYDHTVGLKSDGTVVATGVNDHRQCDVGDWSNIVGVAAGYDHTVGLKSDGTVIAIGDNTYGQCDVGDWTDIVEIIAGYYHTVGIKSDGTVVAVGSNDNGECEV